MLFSALVLCVGFVIIKLKIEGQTTYRNPHATKLQNTSTSTTNHMQATITVSFSNLEPSLSITKLWSILGFFEVSVMRI